MKSDLARMKSISNVAEPVDEVDDLLQAERELARRVLSRAQAR